MSSPRQDVLSRMIVNLQDAGFRTDFTSIYWTYASGFPKAANVSKLIDKRLGMEREVIGKKPCGYITDIAKSRVLQGYRKNVCAGSNEVDITIPASEKAKELDGSYAGFQPKPAVEVILMVMKPLSEKTFVDQALSNGKGITWLDDCRIPFQDDIPEPITRMTESGRPHTYLDGNRPWIKERIENGQPINDYSPNSQGRFPANLLVSDDVLNDGKVRKCGVVTPHNISGGQKTMNTFGKYDHQVTGGYGDTGSYSRYFDLDKWFDTTFPFLAIPKASTSEKNKGLDKWISKVNDGRQTPIDNPFQRGETVRKNIHPTVKPLKLMSWLITLLSRPQDIVLDPFVGSGTTALAAKMLNRRWIGIEKNSEYIEIAQSRLLSSI